MTSSNAVTTSRTGSWVVGTDGSTEAEMALRWGSAQAVGRAESIRVVRAWHLPAAAGAEFGVILPADLEPSEAHQGLDDIVLSASQGGVSVASEVVYGPASRMLLEASDGADLLVVGSRGLGGFRRLLLGSVSQQCATHAAIPVVVVRPPADDAESEPLLTRLVVGVDSSSASRSALRWAHDFAGDKLRVAALGSWAVSVLGIEEMRSELEFMFDDAQHNFNQTLDEMEAELGAAGYFERQFVRGAPARTLVDACGTADLLVVGERGHRGLSGALLGSVATEVLHRARGAVAVIPVASIGRGVV